MNCLKLLALCTTRNFSTLWKGIKITELFRNSVNGETDSQIWEDLRSIFTHLYVNKNRNEFLFQIRIRQFKAEWIDTVMGAFRGCSSANAPHTSCVANSTDRRGKHGRGCSGKGGETSDNWWCSCFTVSTHKDTLQHSSFQSWTQSEMSD